MNTIKHMAPSFVHEWNVVTADRISAAQANGSAVPSLVLVSLNGALRVNIILEDMLLEVDKKLNKDELRALRGASHLLGLVAYFVVEIHPWAPLIDMTLQGRS